MGLRINERNVGDVKVLDLAGLSHNVHDSPPLDLKLSELKAGDISEVILNLQDRVMIDQPLVTMIVQTLNYFRMNDRFFRIVSPIQIIREQFLNVSMIIRSGDVFDSEEAALASLPSNRPLRIALASTSQLKQRVVIEALEELGITNVDLRIFSVPSGVNLQPIGWEETTWGMRIRLLMLRHQNWCASDVIVSIESGLVLSKGAWYDVAKVSAQAKDCKAHEQTSGRLRVPAELVADLKVVGADRITIGQLLAKRHANVDPSDPHKFFTNGKVGRVDLLRDAVKEVLGLAIEDWRTNQAQKKTT